MRGFGRGVRYGFYGELVTPGEILEGPSGLTSHPVPQTCEGLPCSEALGPGPERGKERLVLVLSPDPAPRGQSKGAAGRLRGWERRSRRMEQGSQGAGLFWSTKWGKHRGGGFGICLH